MIKREAEQTLIQLAEQFKAVAVTGPRQSGKTTLVKKIFSEKSYVNLENPDTRLFAEEDPRGFLSNYPNGAIFDEIQRVPALFSFLQEILDESDKNGAFVLTGSNNFLLQESIRQSLAGRVGYLNLLPLSIAEIGNREEQANSLLFKGGYPMLYKPGIDASLWFANYIRTYVERDLRMLKNITDLAAFERFLRLCAGRVGQLLNMSSLAVEVGIDVKTVKSWLSVLETSFVVFLLQPYHKNYNKRLVKMPKLYFYDTGLAIALLGVENTEQLKLHPFRGSLFENLVILEFLKHRLNRGKINNLYFWRDHKGREIDLLLASGTKRVPIEIKSGQTITADYFKGLNFWNKLTKNEGGYVVYGGECTQKRSHGVTVIPFKQTHLIDRLKHEGEKND